MSEEFEQVTRMSDLRQGEATAFMLANGDEVLLIRVREEVFAVQPTCTHRETWLDMGTVLPGSLEIQCPLHEGRFDLRTGEPTNPPVTEPLKTYAVRVADGAVLVSSG